ncbi:hypothetical protein [Burkholderia cepacia]|uniref:Uncharacterized protein n=1 Tax=Burkholderia cepacia GG4 TaxID=1009846 RepID=A0A9W3K1T1_BURCE|nr:hypothetical protein [Burkholderia cepacia]AFQ49454.1 hypothetical protein GEM_3058 [Burkholderia cepacia GG4]
MSERNSYRLTALGRTYDVRRVFLNKKPDFTEDVSRPSGGDASSDSAKSRPTYRRPLLLPTSPFEVEKMDREGVLEKASWVTDTLLLTVDDLPVSRAETLKDLRAKALAEFEGSELSKQQKYDHHTRKRFGKSHNDLVAELREAVVERFKVAFDGILYVMPMESWRQSGAREVVRGYEIAASRQVINEMLQLAGSGHVHSQYLAALLLCFTQRGLTKRSVELLLRAHENAHPQALEALGRLLLAQGEHVGAMQAALLAMQGGYPDAKHTIDEVQRSMTMTVVMTQGGPVPAFMVVLHGLDDKYQALARTYFPDWFPSEADRAAAFFSRFTKGDSHV